MTSAAGSRFPEPARVALWYAVEEAFGGLQYDNFGEASWSEEIEVLEERLRKRLRRLELANERHIPNIVKEFIVENASLEDLMAVAEEAVLIALQSRMQEDGVRALAQALVQAFAEGGADLHFDRAGKLVKTGGIDMAPKAIANLPLQDEFKEDLASQSTDQIGLIFIDLDNFKAVNDQNGHPAGDDCLVRVVEAIGRVIAGKGKLYRYGGDEFAVILRNADVSETTASAERIRRALAAARPGIDIEVTASIGVAASEQTGLAEPERLLKAADECVYESKRLGKNRVTSWTPEA